VSRRVAVRLVEPQRSAVAAALVEAAALLDASMKVRLDAPLLDAARALRVVATATTGADHIDAAALAARGIPLLTLRSEQELLRGLTPAAEHSWLLLMACARRLRAATAHAAKGGWDRELFPGLMLRGRTLGLIGCGRIGTWMARYATAFGMVVLGYDPHLREWPPTIRGTPLPELLASADFVSVHVPLGPETRGLLGSAELRSMKAGAILINTSRGEVVDEGALREALESGALAAAGLDVLGGEPDVASHPLRLYAESHDNLILTPHIGGFSPDTVPLVVAHQARRLLAELER
jgi:D-3-phosphoglycerate dehydrogenase